MTRRMQSVRQHYGDGYNNDAISQAPLQLLFCLRTLDDLVANDILPGERET